VSVGSALQALLCIATFRLSSRQAQLGGRAFLPSLAAFLHWPQSLLFFFASGAAVQPNPSLHPTCYSGLRPLPQAGELKR